MVFVVFIYQRLEKKNYKKRSRRTFRPDMTIPNPELYISSQPPSALSTTTSSSDALPPPVLGFPMPMSPIIPQMHGSNGVSVDSSDEDGNDDEDEFEDSEQTEATATGTDVEESVSSSSEGEVCATPENGSPRAVNKWVTVKGVALPPSPQLLPVVTV